MKHKLLLTCLGAYILFLLGSFAAVLFLTPSLITDYLIAAAPKEVIRYLNSHFVDIQNVCYLLLFVVFLLSLFPAGIFFLAFYRPLSRITDAAAKYTDGYNHPALEYDHDNELGKLAASMNYLAEAVHNSEDSQRKFLSNISHDFRSPLTSIKGYVEAILDGTIPPEMQEKYLSIVVDETERLNKLTEGLLTLNTFDDRGVYLEMTDFDLVPVIRSTADLFEGICQKKNMHIKIFFYASSIQVHADRGKIQQVLYNLLDNAIKFSYSDSVLLIRVYGQKNRIFVSVKDHGEGIAKEHLPKIWDRFYKSDASRGRDKKGTGLGLSIVKEIIHAHGQNINVVSTQNVGTEFTFSLQRATL
ncbi:MAG: GHKL domain-containing protein [Lachnospiraceae bacterium]|jgi:signal transduction histidine kinase|nr:GHKL domain-containing protein [Lachnospiraceae bacterium]